MSLDFPDRERWLAIRNTPRRLPGKRMLVKKFAEGAVHFGQRAAYLEPLPTLRQLMRVLNAHGKLVPVRQPWKRVTPKPVRSGHARRQWLREQRVNT